jgi:hypothetical protein
MGIWHEHLIENLKAGIEQKGHSTFLDNQNVPFILVKVGFHG